MEKEKMLRTTDQIWVLYSFVTNELNIESYSHVLLTFFVSLNHLISTVVPKFGVWETHVLEYENMQIQPGTAMAAMV